MNILVFCISIIFFYVVSIFFRKKKYFKESTLSVLNQSYQNLELIIIYDDYKLDDLEFINKVKELDIRIKLIINSSNIGAGLSRNKGINISKGTYIAFLDGDDIWEKNKLSDQIEFMQKNNYQITHTSYEIINEEGKKIGDRIAKLMNYEKLIKSCDVGLSSVILKKSVLSENLNFPNLKTKEDFVLWLKITKNGENIYALNKNLLKWRKSKNSLSSSIVRKLIDGYCVYRHHLNFGLFKSFLALFVLSINFLKKN